MAVEIVVVLRRARSEPHLAVHGALATAHAAVAGPRLDTIDIQAQQMRAMPPPITHLLAAERVQALFREAPCPLAAPNTRSHPAHVRAHELALRLGITSLPGALGAVWPDTG